MSAQQGKILAEGISGIIVARGAKRACGSIPDHRVPIPGDDVEKGCRP